MVNIESLSMPEFLMMLAWEGDPPPDPEFDKIRMTRHDWETMFPAPETTPTEETDDGAAPAAPAAEHPAGAAAAH